MISFELRLTVGNILFGSNNAECDYQTKIGLAEITAFEILTRHLSYGVTTWCCFQKKTGILVFQSLRIKMFDSKKYLTPLRNG